jgi:hypothetical protein
MNLTVKKLDLFWDGQLPRDSMGGNSHRQIFCEAKPLIDYAFKVERPAFVRVWWFDRQLDQVVDMLQLGERPKSGRFYMPYVLNSETDRFVADYLSELGWQVRICVKSIDRLEYAMLAVFSSQGALLQDDDTYSLRVLEAQAQPPVPPVWDSPLYRTREIAGV